MKENVKVFVETIHHLGDEKDKFHHLGYGRYFFKRGQHFVEYKTVEDGEEVRYLLKLNAKEMALTKTSKQGRYMMELWEDGKTKFNYHTPLGIIQVHIFVHHLEIDIQENQIALKSEYDLLSEGGEQILCEMKIEISEGEEQ